MIILTIRTDKPQAEIGLYENHIQLFYETWEAHRRLAETIHQQIAKILQSADKKLDELGGIVVYKGPGSFTGLRIGVSVANALAYSASIPLVAENEDWIERGINQLLAGHNKITAIPDYGQAPHTTSSKK